MTWLQDILPRIGYGFVSSFWQMALLLALYKLLSSVYFPGAADRFRLASGLSVSGSFWFVYTIVSEKTGPARLIENSFFQDFSELIPAFFQQSMYWLGWAYLALLILSFVKSRMDWKATTRLINSGHSKAPVEWRLFVEKYAALLGIRQKVVLKISGTFSPATFGFLKPVILLPASCLTGLTTVQIEALLLHELAHIRRADYLVAWVMHIAGHLLYFNPFMRQLVREAKKECENACDDLVMQFEYNSLSYAQALLAVAKNGQNTAWVLHAKGSQPHLLLNRIARIMGQPVNHNGISLKTLFIPALSGLIIWASLWQPNIQANGTNITGQTGKSLSMATYEEINLHNSIREARLAILAAATKKERTGSNKKEILEEPLPPREELASLSRDKTLNPDGENPSSPLILTANWADEQNIETGRKEIETAWHQFSVLMEKLEITGDLPENEWQQMAGLITLYADIRKAIYEETASSQKLYTRAFENEPDNRLKVLVIVYEEATGILAASLMDPSEINASYSIENIPENEQPVILIRKTNTDGKKVIRL